jgi:HAD superfamily hydrolase (TIGR01509 family)
MAPSQARELRNESCEENHARRVTEARERRPSQPPRRTIDAVVFDLDGVLIQSEEVWDAVREAYVRECGGRYDPIIQRAMMGMSSVEWSRYLHEVAGVPDEPPVINDEVVRRILAYYRTHLPLIDGALDTVRRIAAAYPLGLASSSNRLVIDAVLDLAGLAPFFRATVSSEEVPRGKPAPDVYLEAARRLGVAPARCAAIEDSGSGIRSAKTAGMIVIAIPNQRYPPDEAALAQADVVIRTVAQLTSDLIDGATAVPPAR